MTSESQNFSFPDALVESKRAVFEQEARKLAAEADREELRLETEKRMLAMELASNRFHRVYHFDTPVNELSVKTCIMQLTEWHRIFPEYAMDLIFNSPGGDLIEGFALFDYILHLRKEGHHITTTALGMAASTAGVLLQAGDKRVMGPDAWLLIHQGSYGVGGSVGAIEDTVEWMKKVRSRVLDIYAMRSTMPRDKIEISLERKDWWMSAQEALEHGFIDEIG